jgi:predicted patatin/cPLA2 family phospholipase
MEKVGLVLEGGGMRGVYTAGVLECFLDEGIHFPYVLSVSAGACNAASYISRQKGRNRIVTIDYVKHPRYLSLFNLIRERSLFGMQLLFDELPNRLVPFDYEAFYRDPTKFWVVMTDAVTGEALYKEKGETIKTRDMLTYIRASCSLPFVSAPVRDSGLVLFDGGIADPIPIHKSMADGNTRHVVVLTKEEGYKKKPSKNRWISERFYPQYPGLTEAMIRRSQVYNASLEVVEELQSKDQAIVLRPSVHVGVGRMTKDQRKLTALYDLGYQDALAKVKDIKDMLPSIQ